MQQRLAYSTVLFGVLFVGFVLGLLPSHDVMPLVDGIWQVGCIVLAALWIKVLVPGLLPSKVDQSPQDGAKSAN